MSYFVKILLSPVAENLGLKIPLEEGETSVGRASPPCKIQLDSPKVSKRHCSFLVKGEALSVVDHNSSNGLYVNGKKVVNVALKDKDRLVIGEFTLEVTVK